MQRHISWSRRQRLLGFAPQQVRFQPVVQVQGQRLLRVFWKAIGEAVQHSRCFREISPGFLLLAETVQGQHKPQTSHHGGTGSAVGRQALFQQRHSQLGTVRPELQSACSQSDQACFSFPFSSTEAMRAASAIATPDSRAKVHARVAW